MSPTLQQAQCDSPVDHIDCPLALRHIPLTFDNADPDKSALQLVQEFCPQWVLEEGPIEFVRFTDGITNTLTKAIKRRPGQTKSQIDQDAILLRAYGKGTDVLIDRERELKAHNLLATLGLAPALLARFDNGLMYRFVEGEVCSPEDLRKPEIYRQVAKRLGQWHGSLPTSALTPKSLSNGYARAGICDSQDQDGSRPIPNTWTVMEQWIEALPNQTNEERTRIDVLKRELQWVSKQLGDTPGLLGKDYVFSHCDLLSGNVIVAPYTAQERSTNGSEPVERSVDFIDYEYATPSPAAFDLANHFAEWAGFECDHGAVPTRSQRREFLQHYVASFHKYQHAANGSKQSTPGELQQDVDTIFNQVDLFRGIPGLYWGIWSLIQAQISQIDFNYASYAELRLGEYWAWKAEYDGSRARERRELTVRECRWAKE